jgi:hypothetical protein
MAAPTDSFLLSQHQTFAPKQGSIQNPNPYISLLQHPGGYSNKLGVYSRVAETPGYESKYNAWVVVETYVVIVRSQDCLLSSMFQPVPVLWERLGVNSPFVEERP